MLAPILDWQNMLPDGVFKSYVDSSSRVTEAYAEYNYFGMINILSILSGRKFCFYLPWEDLHEQNTSFLAPKKKANGSVYNCVGQHGNNTRLMICTRKIGGTTLVDFFF